MKRIILILCLFTFNRSLLNAQLLDGFNFLSQIGTEDSIIERLRNRQLKGLMAALNDNSPIVKDLVIFQLDNQSNYWSKNLPDSCINKIIDLLSSPNSATQKRVLEFLTNFNDLNSSVLAEVIPLISSDDLKIAHNSQVILAFQDTLPENTIQTIFGILNNNNNPSKTRSFLEIFSLISISDYRIIKKIAPFLDHENEGIRNSALFALQQTKDLNDSILIKIIPLLKANDLRTRVNASNLLSRQKKLSSKVIDQIIPLFKDSDPANRSFAISSLNNPGVYVGEYIKVIFPFASDESSYVSQEVFKILEHIETTEFIRSEELIPFLANPDSSVRISVLNALNSRGPILSSFQNNIASLLNDQSIEVQEAAFKCLLSIDQLSPLNEKKILQLAKSGKLEFILKYYDVILEKFNVDLLGQVISRLNDKSYITSWDAKRTIESQSSFTLENVFQIIDLIEDDLNSYNSKRIFQILEEISPLEVEVVDSLLSVLDSESDYNKGIVLKILGYQNSLDKDKIEKISKMLYQSDPLVIESTLKILTKNRVFEESLNKQVISYLKDTSKNVRGEAINYLRLQDSTDNVTKNIQYIFPLLKDKDMEVRVSAMLAICFNPNVTNEQKKRTLPLLKDSSIFASLITSISFYRNSVEDWYQYFPFLSERALMLYNEVTLSSISQIDGEQDKESDKEISVNPLMLRMLLYEVSGGDPRIILPLKWLCRPSKLPQKISIKEARNTLDLILGMDFSERELPLFNNELGNVIPEIIRAVEGGWQTKDLKRLEKSIEVTLKVNPTKTAFIQDQINELQNRNYVFQIFLLIAFHFLAWAMLFAFYARNILIRKNIFWDPLIRQWLGLGYVEFLLTRIPWLRRKIFEPFNDDLLSGAFPALWNKEEYYPKADIFSAKDKREMPIMETLIPFEGQALVEGASGLGKTMFLRKVAEDAPQVMVYLAASDCSEGLIPGIQRKLPIAQHDPDFLQALVYAGAIDILIDGLNEISANACARLTNEIVQHFKGNLIMTTQPMDWEAPASARQYELLPLGEADTREFLATRYPFINRTDAINESAYKKRCEDYLAEAFDSNLDDDTLKANNQILSNPMDLVLVAQLIARGEKPSLLDLQEQQYQVMAKDFKKVNQQADFPLAKFSEVVFQMRLDDKREIPDEEFQAEIKAMDRWKMVVSRIQVNEENREVKKWYFRHDKIMDFFMTQEFLKRKDLIPAHFDDPRFRGVYFLLAFKLEYQQAAQLREELIQHAVDTKDHTLSDAFIELFKRRERPPMEMIKQTQDKVADLVSSGEPVEAIQALKNHVRGELKDELSVLEGRAKKLERVSRVGAVEFEKEKVEFNSISLAVLNLSRRIFQS